MWLVVPGWCWAVKERCRERAGWLTLPLQPTFEARRPEHKQTLQWILTTEFRDKEVTVLHTVHYFASIIITHTNTDADEGHKPEPVDLFRHFFPSPCMLEVEGEAVPEILTQLLHTQTQSLSSTLKQTCRSISGVLWSPVCLIHTDTKKTHMCTCSHTHADTGSHVGYLSWAAGDGDPVLTGDVTGTVVGGAGTWAWCTVAYRLWNIEITFI